MVHEETNQLHQTNLTESSKKTWSGSESEDGPGCRGLVLPCPALTYPNDAFYRLLKGGEAYHTSKGNEEAEDVDAVPGSMKVNDS